MTGPDAGYVWRDPRRRPAAPAAPADPVVAEYRRRAQLSVSRRQVRRARYAAELREARRVLRMMRARRGA